MVFGRLPQDMVPATLFEAVRLLGRCLWESQAGRRMLRLPEREFRIEVVRSLSSVIHDWSLGDPEVQGVCGHLRDMGVTGAGDQAGVLAVAAHRWCRAGCIPHRLPMIHDLLVEAGRLGLQAGGGGVNPV